MEDFNTKKNLEKFIVMLDDKIDQSIYNIARSFLALEESHNIEVLRKGNNDTYHIYITIEL